MSVRRLALTATAMALTCVLLGWLTPPLAVMTDALAHAQRTADTEGAQLLVTSAAGLLAWVVWVWGVAGLGLTALSVLPGAAGSACRLLLQLLLPAGARRAAAVFLGLGLAVTGPAVVTTVAVFPTVASAAVPGPPSLAAVPDWPVAVPADGPVPDWPASGTADSPDAGSPAAQVPAGSRVVLRGDCLWDIAATWLRQSASAEPTDGEIAAAVHAWWAANDTVIGPNPDLLLPGQVLVPPDPP